MRFYSYSMYTRATNSVHPVNMCVWDDAKQLWSLNISWRDILDSLSDVITESGDVLHNSSDIIS